MGVAMKRDDSSHEGKPQFPLRETPVPIKGNCSSHEEEPAFPCVGTSVSEG